MSELTADEIARVQRYLRDKFGTDRLGLKARSRDPSSVEVLLGGEFLGVIYKDTEDGGTAYDFNMAILSEDLPDAA